MTSARDDDNLLEKEETVDEKEIKDKLGKALLQQINESEDKVCVPKMLSKFNHDTANILSQGKRKIKARYGLKLSEQVVNSFCGPREFVCSAGRFIYRQILGQTKIAVQQKLGERGVVGNGLKDSATIKVPVTCLFNSPDALNFTLIGWADGHFEIRDTQTLKNVLYEKPVAKEEEKQVWAYASHTSSVVGFQFNIDHKYANLVVQYKNWEVQNYILERNREWLGPTGCFFTEINRAQPTTIREPNMAQGNQPKEGREESLKQLSVSAPGFCRAGFEKAILPEVEQETQGSKIEQEVAFISTFISSSEKVYIATQLKPEEIPDCISEDKQSSINLSNQNQQQIKKQDKISLIDLDYVCNHDHKDAKLDQKKFNTHVTISTNDFDASRIQFIELYKEHLIIGYPVRNNIKGQLYCRLEVHQIVDKPNKDEKTTEIIGEYKNEKVQCSNKDEAVGFLKVRYGNQTCIAISNPKQVELYSLANITPRTNKQKEVPQLVRITSIIDSFEDKIRDISQSPCGRILIVSENERFNVWDMQHCCQVFTQKCEGKIICIEHFTTDIVIIQIQDDLGSNQQQEFDWIALDFGEIFTHNNMTLKTLKGVPLRTIPLSFYKDEFEHGTIIMDVDYQTTDDSTFSHIDSLDHTLNFLKNKTTRQEGRYYNLTGYGVDYERVTPDTQVKFIQGKYMFEFETYQNEPETVYLTRTAMTDEEKLKNARPQKIIIPFNLETDAWVLKSDAIVVVATLCSTNRASTDKNADKRYLKYYEYDFEEDFMHLYTYDDPDEDDFHYIKWKKRFKCKMDEDWSFGVTFISADCRKVAAVFQTEDDSNQIISFDAEKGEKEAENSQHCAPYEGLCMSPLINLTLNCSSNINGHWEIREMQKADSFSSDACMPRRKIISKKEHGLDGKRRFFTPCEEYVGVEVENSYKFFRVFDGTYLGSMQKYKIKMVQDNKGGCSMIVGMIDLQGRTFYEWSLKAFVHLSQEKIVLTKHDTKTFTFDLDSYSLSIQSSIVLGLPMPSLQPHCYQTVQKKQFNESFSNTQRHSYLKMLNQYTIFDSYQNLIHLLAYENKAEFLSYVMNETPLRYLICIRSPLEIGKSQCCDEIMDYLTKENHSNHKEDQDEDEMLKLQISGCISLEGFKKIIQLPEFKSLKYLNCLTKDLNEFLPSLNLQSATLREEPITFHKLPNLQKLKDSRQMSKFITQELLGDDQGDDESRKPVCFVITMCKLPLVFGSKQSIELHQKLKDAGEGEHFKSKTIERYLGYKWNYIRKLGWILSGLYGFYLLCLILWPHWFVLSLWVVFHVSIEIYQFKQSTEGFLGYFDSVWNYFDIARLSLQIIQIILQLTEPEIPQIDNLLAHGQGAQEAEVEPFGRGGNGTGHHDPDAGNVNERSTKVKSMSFLMLFAWISTLGYSRYFKATRVFIKMILQTVYEMRFFFSVVMVLLISFTMTYAYGFEDSADAIEGEEVFISWEGVRHSFLLQYKVMFGDLAQMGITAGGATEDPDGCEEPATEKGALDHIFYYLVAIIIPLVMLNLLIAVISETHSKVMDSQEMSDLSEENSVILELETFWALWNTYNRIEEQPQEHLIYAEYNDDYQKHEWQGRIQATTDKVRLDLGILKASLEEENESFRKEVREKLEKKQQDMKNMFVTIMDKSNKDIVQKLQESENPEVRVKNLFRKGLTLSSPDIFSHGSDRTSSISPARTPQHTPLRTRTDDQT